MEYIPDALDRHLQGGTRLPWERATEIAVQIARALQHAHDQGVVHRDIKPQNILLTEDGTVKVSDFGIARVLASSTRSRTASVMGTPEYMSPEQWSSGSLDGRLDQYSLGIVFYQMLVGTTPFQGESMEAIYVQHRETPLPALPGNLQVPRAVQQVIRRATEKSQGDRYASSGEMADALEVALGRTPTRGGQSTQQPPPPQPPRQPAGSGSGSGRISGSHSLLFGGLSAIVIVVISVVIAMFAASGTGGDGEMVQLAAPAPTYTPYPTPTAMPTLTATPTPLPTVTPTPVPTATPRPPYTVTLLPTYTPFPTSTPFPTRSYYYPSPTPFPSPNVGQIAVAEKLAEIDAAKLEYLKTTHSSASWRKLTERVAAAYGLKNRKDAEGNITWQDVTGIDLLLANDEEIRIHMIPKTWRIE